MAHEHGVTVRPAVHAVLEDAGANWSAYAPAFPGVAGVGATAEDAQRSLEEGLMYLFEEMQQREEAAMAAEDAARSAG